MGEENSVLVIGAGLAGLTAAWRVAIGGCKVRVVAKGWGATHWHAGCVDVLGYYPVDAETVVASPAAGIEVLVKDNPNHPYGLIGVEGISAALEAFKTLCGEAGYPLRGSIEKNWLLPSALGAVRPTCLAPETMIGGDLTREEPVLIVGFDGFGDFFPMVTAGNLKNQGVEARHAMLKLPSLEEAKVINGVILARMMEEAWFRAKVAELVRYYLGTAERVGFPAVLGLGHAMAVKADLEVRIGRPVFEIPVLPPSVPGMRLHHILKGAVERHGGRVFEGMEAVEAEVEGGNLPRRVTAVYTEAAGRNRPHRFDHYILATGGILGGGITTNSEGQAREVVFDLPVSIPQSRLDWFGRDFTDQHAVYRAGLVVGGDFRPVDEDGRVVLENVYAAGTTLAHAEVIRERSMEGVAVSTGFTVGEGVIGD